MGCLRARAPHVLLQARKDQQQALLSKVATSLKGLTLRVVRYVEDFLRWYLNHASAASKRKKKATAAPIPIPTSAPVLSPDEWVVEAGILENTEEEDEDGDGDDGDDGPVEVVENIESEEAVEIVEGCLDISRPTQDGKGYGSAPA
jgi:hypothetical protein